jgi:nitric oxide reductase activation protein
VASNDYRIFEKKGNPNDIDSCVSIVWDGSGSMCGDKQKRSTMACAIIEEALKPLMPMKITNFTTEYRLVKHFQVKKFDDRDMNKNYAYSYGSSRSFNGGNKDGYSIKIASAELMRRPEQNKILIVLSDGLPSDYPSHSKAIGDVREAVKAARKNGIKVIAIFFGDEGFRKNTMDEYREMYEKNLISCAPQDISKELVKQIRMLFMQK